VPYRKVLTRLHSKKAALPAPSSGRMDRRNNCRGILQQDHISLPSSERRISTCLSLLSLIVVDTQLVLDRRSWKTIRIN
jgi:hypothetical protein